MQALSFAFRRLQSAETSPNAPAGSPSSSRHTSSSQIALSYGYNPNPPTEDWALTAAQSFYRDPTRPNRVFITDGVNIFEIQKIIDILFFYQYTQTGDRPPITLRLVGLQREAAAIKGPTRYDPTFISVLANNQSLANLEFPEIDPTAIKYIAKALIIRKLNLPLVPPAQHLTKLEFSNSSLDYVQSALIAELLTTVSVAELLLNDNPYMFFHETVSQENKNIIINNLKEKKDLALQNRDQKKANKYQTKIDNFTKATERQTLREILMAKGLKTLNISNTGIESDGVDILFTAAENPTLTALDASKNHFNESSRLRLALRKIEKLKLGPKVSSQEFQQIERSFTQRNRS